ncbi:MAG: GNAT family N-acetyltransferase, partial [Pseudomonadota bacterium]
RIDTPSFREWEAIWRACDYATFFHSPYWAELWERFTGNRRRSAAERITFSDGRVAIVPLVHEHKLGGLLSRYASSPEATFGGWISKDPLEPEHADRLLDRLLTQLPESLVWRMNPFDPLVLEAGVRRELRCRADSTHAVELNAEPEVLLRNFRNGYRDDIRKAMKRGHISVEPARSLEDWRAYYEVYQRTLERWGHRSDQGYPWELFECMTSLGCPDLTLWLARYDERIVSGELCMYAQRHVVTWHAATLREYLRENVAKVQIYRIIADARQRGYAWFDFNPSAGLPGVLVFKESFNAKALPAPLVYVDSPLKSIIRRVAATVGVPYAALDLQPLSEILANVEQQSESANA